MQTDRQEQNTRHAERATAVSVVIPAYNCSKYIGEALDSVFAQTFSDYEVVVVNDGSPDTEELEQVLLPYRERIVYIKQKNTGPSGARNTAILVASGEYVAFLDSDDIWMPDYLAEQVKLLRSDPAITLACADAQLFGDSSLSGQTFMGLWPSQEPVTFKKLLTMQCAVLTMCVVARRQSLIDVGMFDTEFLRSEDYHLWLRLAHKGERFAYLQMVVAYHRLHEASLAADGKSLYESQIAVYEKLLKTLPVSPEERRVLVKQIERSQADLALLQGKQRMMDGQFDEAAEALEHANGYYHSYKLRFALLSLRFAPELVRRIYHLRNRLAARRTTAAI